MKMKVFFIKLQQAVSYELPMIYGERHDDDTGKIVRSTFIIINLKSVVTYI